MLKLKLVTAPTAEPVLIDEALAQVRVDIADDNNLIQNLIKVSRQDVEAYLNRALVTQTWDYYLDAFPGKPYLDIPLPPLQSITSIKYTDKAGTEATFASSSYYVDTIREPGRVHLKWNASWPAVDLREANGVVVRFVAGYGAAADVPDFIKQAILLQVGTLYENREDVIVGNVQQMKLIGGAEHLLTKVRIYPI